MLLYAVDVAPGLAARLPEVAGVLDLLDDSGGHLADTVGHGDPAGGTDLHLLLALGTDHVKEVQEKILWVPKAPQNLCQMLEIRNVLLITTVLRNAPLQKFPPSDLVLEDLPGKGVSYGKRQGGLGVKEHQQYLHQLWQSPKNFLCHVNSAASS